MLNRTIPKTKVSLPREEYLRLKRLDQRFGQLVGYFEYISGIKQSRKEAKIGEVIEQEKLFKQLGI